MKKYCIDVILKKRKGIIPALIRDALFLASLVFFPAVCLRNLLFDIGILRIHKVNCKVISIGNITWGGTGKTPLVEFMADFYSKAGKKAVILTRGYGKDAKSGIADEPALLKNNLSIPVLVNTDRVASALAAISEFKPDIILLDDGFQYRRLRRDLDIVAINATEPFGNNFLIPRGSLREPVSGLKRADLILLTKIDSAGSLKALTERIKNINKGALIACASYAVEFVYDIKTQDKLDSACLKGKKILTVSAIADPDSFRSTLKSQGADVIYSMDFVDHYIYNDKDLVYILNIVESKNPDFVVVTEKDAVKLRPLIEHAPMKINTKILVLKISLRISQGQEELFARLNSLIYC